MEHAWQNHFLHSHCQQLRHTTNNAQHPAGTKGKSAEKRGFLLPNAKSSQHADKKQHRELTPNIQLK